MNAHMISGRPFDLKAVVYAVDEHGRDVLKESTEIHMPAYFQQLAEFKQYVFDFVGVDSILDEVGFSQFDVMFYRLAANKDRFAIRTQHQYSLEMTRFYANSDDCLEVMICKKIMASVRGRLGSILIVPTEPGNQIRRQEAEVPRPLVFQNDGQVEELILPLTNDRQQGCVDRRRKRNPRKAEDDDLFEKIRHTDIVQRNERQQAMFDELAEMLSAMHGSLPISEGKFLCGICGKERLVCPNRNNVGRIKYFRRKHYDNCLSSGGRGMYKGSKPTSYPGSEALYSVDDSVDGSSERSWDKTTVRELTPTTSYVNVINPDRTEGAVENVHVITVKKECGDVAS